MEHLNNITTVTRQNIADHLTLAHWWYHGRLDEPTFLSRLFDLRSIPSKDNRYKDASGEIQKHTVMNTDWEPDWIFADSRFGLRDGPDDNYLRFLCETIHPVVRSNEEEIQEMLALYNKHLAQDGFEIIAVDKISGRSVFKGVKRLDGANTLQTQKVEIEKYLNTKYVQNKLAAMNNAMHTDTDLAIGTAKELLETVCKSILQQKEISVDKDWPIARLLKETTNSLDFAPKRASEPEKAVQSIRQILAGIGTIIHGVAELRNSYGSGHGKEADFQGLEPKYAKFLVGLIAEIVVFYLATNGEMAAVEEVELVIDLPY